MRVSSPSMAAAAIEGAADGGADVLDLGMVGTEMVYFAVGELGLDGGICVTASHNPKEYTGMKIVRRGALPVGGDSGLEHVRDRALRGDWRDAPRRGEVATEDIWDGFVERVLSFVDAERDPAAARRRRRRERDGRGDAAAGARAAPAARRRALLLRARRDVPEPRAEPAASREPRVHRPHDLEEHADLGVAYDGDADRCFFVDDTGEFVPGDFVDRAVRRADPREGARRRRSSTTFAPAGPCPRRSRRPAAMPLVNRVGHAFIKHRMREVGAVFAGEVSAHYYFRDFSQADSGVVPFLLMLELVSRPDASCRSSWRRFRARYFLTGEINTPVADVALKLQELKERFGPRGRASRTWTASPSTSTTGTSTFARRTPSRSYG